MAVSPIPTDFDKYGNPTAFDIQQIIFVSEGDIVKDSVSGKVLSVLPRPARGFDVNPTPTIAKIKLIDEQEQPLGLSKMADALSIIINGVQPECDNNDDMEIRHRVSGNSVFLQYRAPEVGGVSKDFAVVSLLASEMEFDEHLGSRLCAVFDRKGDQSLDNLPPIKETASSRVETLVLT